MQVIPDPRLFPQVERVPSTRQSDWYRSAVDSLGGATGQDRDALDSHLRQALAHALREGEVALLRQALDGAPSAPVCRHLLRMLASAWRESAADAHSGLAAHGFAVPVVIVAAAASALEFPAVLDDVPAIVSLLRDHGALGGNEAFGLANVLAGPDAVGVASLPQWLTWRGTIDSVAALREVKPAVLRVAAGQESAHVGYLVGTALGAPEARLFEQSVPGTWGMPLAQLLSRQLAMDGLQILALPKAPTDPVTAAQVGMLAQREIALQLFSSSAIRDLRATFGEPTAVISAHRLGRAGELRVSLSSPFGDRDAAGFRCPLYPFERIEEVTEVIVDLLRACRLTDIRAMSGVHPDRDPRTGLTLLFRGDVVGPGEAIPYH